MPHPAFHNFTSNALDHRPLKRKFCPALTTLIPPIMPNSPPDPAVQMHRHDQQGPDTVPGRTIQGVDPSRGGWVTHRPPTTPDRLIIDFEPALCCSRGPGIPGAHATELPLALAARGVPPYEWADAVQRLRTQVQPLSTSVCCGVTAAVSVVCLPALCWRERRYQAALGAWVDGLNAAVLQPRGMFAKLQTNSYHEDTGPTSDYDEEISWLAVAMTPVEAAALAAEPVFWTPGWCTPAMTRHPCQGCFCCCGQRRVV